MRLRLRVCKRTELLFALTPLPWIYLTKLYSMYSVLYLKILSCRRTCFLVIFSVLLTYSTV